MSSFSFCELPKHLAQLTNTPGALQWSEERWRGEFKPRDWAGLSLAGKLPPGHSWVDFFFFLAVLGSCHSVSCSCWVNELGISVRWIFTHTKHQATVAWQCSLASSCTFWQVFLLLGEAIFILLACGRKWLLQEGRGQDWAWDGFAWDEPQKLGSEEGSPEMQGASLSCTLI